MVQKHTSGKSTEQVESLVRYIIDYISKIYEQLIQNVAPSSVCSER